MKTLEMIQQAYENKGCKFESEDAYEKRITVEARTTFNKGKSVVHNGLIVHHDGSSNEHVLEITEFWLGREWQEVREAHEDITYKEAVKLWCEGETVSCKVYNSIHVYKPGEYFLDEQGNAVWKCEMLKSKWYKGDITK